MSKDDRGRKENIFEIMDGMMKQLNRTKKVFVIMIITVMVVPPVGVLAVISIIEPPFEIQVRMQLDDRLDSGAITQQEYDDIIEKLGDGPRHFPAVPHVFILAMSLIWLGIGIWQWLVLSRWAKRYRKFKKAQSDIDRQLADDGDSDD